MRDIIKTVQDYRHLRWDERTVTSGTSGTFLKARTTTSRGITYYKLSCYDRYRGIYGHESVNELLASRLLAKFSIPHIPYRLVHACVYVDGAEHVTWLSESKEYRKGFERRQALETYISLDASSVIDPLEYCKQKHWQNDIYKMMAFDYLIVNRDRHGANVEVIITDGVASLAPLFDHGLSFVFSCYDSQEKISAFDPLRDVAANNYFGTRSLEENLKFLPQATLQLSFEPTDFSWLFANLESVLTSLLREKIEEILTKRLKHLLDLGIAQKD